MTPHVYRAPAVDGGLLEQPPLADAPALLRKNADSLAAWSHDFQGRDAERLRAMARAQVLVEARAFHAEMGLDLPEASVQGSPLVVTGHQPELFHPGVWVKNFAVSSLSHAVSGSGLNIIVDNDVPKAPSIRVPQMSDGDLSATPLPFDDWIRDVPYEDLHVHNRDLFESFGSRCLERLDGLVPDPLIRSFWPRVLESPGRVGFVFSKARHATEVDWGVRNWEVPLSRLCRTEAFFWFASHLLAHLPRFQEVHNQALAEYRELYGIRSTHHPVPALGQQAEWREAPFWVWRKSEPRRKPLLARTIGDRTELRIGGEDRSFIDLPLSETREACCAVEALATLESKEIRLRTRALTTTMFARLLLGDLFLHGIGGAKYDELGDVVARRFFGFDPPGYLTLSLTSWLGIPQPEVTPEDYRRALWSIRDVTYNPDRNLPPEVAAEPGIGFLLQAKAELLEAPQDTHAERLARFRRFRELGLALQPLVAEEKARRIERKAKLASDLRNRTVARSREYAAVLHSESRLRERLLQSTQIPPAGTTGMA